jgi:hypothetical protein
MEESNKVLYLLYVRKNSNGIRKVKKNIMKRHEKRKIV